MNTYQETPAGTLLRSKRINKLQHVFIFDHHRGILTYSLILILGLFYAATSMAAEEETATSLIFTTPYLKKLGVPASISYGYSHKTPDPKLYGSEFQEKVSVNVHKPRTESGFNSVGIIMENDRGKREIGPFDNTSGNPVVMVFLERELRQMRSRVGGTPVYFRNTIRRAFRDSALVEPVEITVDGKQVAAKRVTITPFVDDENVGRFGKFRGKKFETIVADIIPGGIYEMKSTVPDDGKEGAPLVTNILRYNTSSKK